MTTTAAAIVACEPTTLIFGPDDRLACLYVVVDGRTDPEVVDFLSSWHSGCDRSEIDWQAVERTRSALVGIELTHTCAEEDLARRRLRLVFDVQRDADALQHLAATEALVVGTRPYGAFANTVAAFGVDGDSVRHATGTVWSELEALAAAGAGRIA